MWRRKRDTSPEFQRLIALARQGDPWAQAHIGLSYLNGKEVQRDYEEAGKWLRLAAEQGIVEARVWLGMMYLDGDGVRQDYKEAAKWLRLAAEQGDPYAQGYLGAMYDEGCGVPQDYLEAIKWHRKAAEKGNVKSQYELGCMYAAGNGAPQDYGEAAKWFHAAAEQGDASAQFNLGCIYADGAGVPQDFCEAYKWLALAAKAGGKDAAKLRDEIAAFMTSSQVREAEQLVVVWQPVRENEVPPGEKIQIRPGKDGRTDIEVAAVVIGEPDPYGVYVDSERIFDMREIIEVTVLNGGCIVETSRGEFCIRMLRENYNTQLDSYAVVCSYRRGDAIAALLASAKIAISNGMAEAIPRLVRRWMDVVGPALEP